MHLCSSAPLKPGWCVFHVLAPLFSPPASLFSRYISLSFSLSELAQCANVSTLPFICQSPEQRPAPSVYLCLHSAAPSALLCSSSPIPPLLKNPSSPPSYILFIPSSPPQSPIFPNPFLQLCCIPFLLIAPLPSHFHFLHHSCFTHPLTLSLRPSSRSWIMALHWSNTMTFPVLSTTSASRFFWD